MGTGLPILFAIYAMPIIITKLGQEQFGVLTLVWVIVGYFTLFDFGIARALIKEVSRLLAKHQENEISNIVWTSLTLMVIVGLFFGGVLALLSPIISSVLQTEEVSGEVVSNIVKMTAASIPIVLISSALRGVVEAHQRFLFIGLMKLIMGCFVFIAPLVVFEFTTSLNALVLTLIFGRVVVFVFYSGYCLKLVVGLTKFTFCSKSAKYLLSFGGWIMVSSVVGPVLLYLDRFMIAGVVGLSTVAYYTTPFEIVSKALILPVAVITVLFPVFSKPFDKNIKDIKWAYSSGAMFLFILVAPAAILFIIYARELMELWLKGEMGVDAIDFVQKSYKIAQILMLGIVINSFGHLSQSLIQGYGRPDLTAKLQLIELCFFAVYLWFLVTKYGENGAAIAWLIRVSISTLALSAMALMCLSQKIKPRYT